MDVVTRKKLIEVGLPLEKINEAAGREKSIRHGHPSTLHLWWARRPLAAARAVIFAQMVDDPSSHPERFKTEKAQEKERQRLFQIIEELVVWENTTNERVLDTAREEIRKSWQWTCEDNKRHPRAKELFDPKKLPAFHDPFAGGGALPLEAQRLGLESYASDLNPVAVLINKAMIEIPPMFDAQPPVNQQARKERKESVGAGQWRGAQGLADDVRYYGQWMCDDAEKRIGHLYPMAEITAQMAKERQDLGPLVGKKLTVIAWLWARTVKSPNPAFAQVDVPLASTFMLSRMKGNEAYVSPVVEGHDYRFSVRSGTPIDPDLTTKGTKLSRGANFSCLMSGTPIDGDYIMAEGQAGRIGSRLMAIVAEGPSGRVYLSPTDDMETAARSAKPIWKPEVEFFKQALGFRVGNYGMTKWCDLFTNRQLAALTTFADLVEVVRKRVQEDAASSMQGDNPAGSGAAANTAIKYSDAVALYLAFVVSGLAGRMSTICVWDVGGPTWGTKINQTFGRQAIPMSWDFAEANPFSRQSGSFWNSLDYTSKAIRGAGKIAGTARQADASTQEWTRGKVVSTDPPYYDNIGYADLSDYFYVWLRRSLGLLFADLFTTIAVPKAEELVATPGRHGGKEKAEAFFLDGMTRAMHRLAEHAHCAFPLTIYYAFKQSESNGDEGVSSTGWETFLDAVIRAGLAISGTWPMRTELSNRMRGKDSNALASSIVLVCRPRTADALTATRREFVTLLKTELPVALALLKRESIAPVDLAQAAIGPGMAIYTRHERVLEADGSAMQVRTALQIINQELDSILTASDSAYDAATRWALKWFDQCGHEDGSFGDANTFANAMNVGVNGLVESGIVVARGGKVRLLRRIELHEGSPLEWDPTKDRNISAWGAVQHIIHRHQEQGVEGAAALVSNLGSRADVAKDLAYRLYNICDRKKWQADALAYNALVAEWNDIVERSRQSPRVESKGLFG